MPSAVVLMIWSCGDITACGRRDRCSVHKWAVSISVGGVNANRKKSPQIYVVQEWAFVPKTLPDSAILFIVVLISQISASANDLLAFSGPDSGVFNTQEDINKTYTSLSLWLSVQTAAACL